MALGSVLQTALTGLSAAQSVMGVVANNLANSQTKGFKASSVSFATQVPQTTSSGAAPSSSNGGTNPMQVGLGVRTAGTSVDFSQGTIAIDSKPLNMALQGDGFFILEGSQGERMYTRNGEFDLNADGEIVSAAGKRVLGFAADNNFQIQTGQLTPLRIRQGMPAESEDGSVATLTGFAVGEDGRIRGSFTDGVSRDLGQIQVARFANPSGLQQRGDNVFTPGPNSGLPVEGSPQDAGMASIVAGATELSNTDIGQNLVDLTLASNQFRASLAVINTSEEMFDDLLRLHRAK